MPVLDNLQPKKVFHYFEEICSIPHGSRNTKQISDYCVKFAEEHGLEYYQDNDNNVIIIKEASKDCENIAPVIIQGHLDMVCEKVPTSDIDMENEGLKIGIDGDEIYADGTTLGGDDGIAVAMALAVLDDDTLTHPRIEAVFTVDEEIGMLGAVTIDVSPLKGKRLLNIDSEEEGIFTVSCAGGNVAKCTLPLKGNQYSGEAILITITGLKGGHSGVEINKGRANANVLMGRLLQEVKKTCGLRILSVAGGLKDNAIPRESKAVVAVDCSNTLSEIIQKYKTVFKNEYSTADSDISVTYENINVTDKILQDDDTTNKVIYLLDCLPNGIQAMSMDIEGLVQTSLNMGIVNTLTDSLEISFCVRSSVDTQKEMLNRRLDEMMTMIGGQTAICGDYPGWEYKKDSSLRELLIRIYEEQYGEKPRVEAIHAGVECGMFAGKIQDLDCVSFGPNLTQIHTVRERMSISSVERVYKFLLEILKRIQ